MPVNKAKRGALGKLLLLALLGAACVAATIYYVTHASESNASATAAVRINEVMTSNKGSVPDGLGDYPDWVELYNTTDAPLDISGYGLGDDLLEGAKYVFPAGTVLPADGYIVVFCAGEAKDDLHAAFKLSATDDLLLYETDGRILDSIELRAVASGHTLALADTGAWEEMSPSPGYPNTEEGAAAYKASLEEGEDIGLYINEFMPSNKSVLMDMYGVYSDWIELYNATNAAIDLSGFGISDNSDQPMKYVLPEGVSIEAGGYLLLFCSGSATTPAEGELHVPFGLRAYEEEVVLSNAAGRRVDATSYSRMEADVSMARIPDGTGEFAQSTRPTPGYPNTDAGYAQFESANKLARGPLYISEMMGDNATALSYNGAYGDWVELANDGPAAIDLTGYGLTNNANNPAKWVFPAVSIEPGERLVLHATGKSGEASAEKKNLELNFRIASTGETLYLFDPQGKLVDKLAAGQFLPDVSCGRGGEDILYYTQSTPGAPNAETGYAGITGTPRFSMVPGIYEGAQALTITAGDGESIYYTLDCTTPTTSSTLYTGPLSIEKNTVVRAIARRDSYLDGYTASGTYLFTTDGVQHGQPIVTLITDPKNLWDEATGIYAFGENFDAETTKMDAMLVSANFYQGKKSEEDQAKWERSASFALFSEQGRQVFAQDVDIRIAGSFGRSRAQKAFNITARSTYGSSRMAYPFFADRPYTEYKSVVLRAGAQDQNYSKIRDELATGLVEGTDMHILVQASRPVVLYLNGEYWGAYFLKEKRSRFFVAQHEGVENTDEMDIVKSSTRVSYGTAEEWNKLMEYVTSHDLSGADAYAHVAQELDIDSFTDYMIAEIWSANTDTWNVQYYKLPGGKWKFIYYDFCWSMRDSAHKTLAYRRDNTKPLSDLFNGLLKNSTYRDAFVKRFAYLLKNVYNAERVNALIDTLYGYVEPEIAREREKFNQETFMGVKQLAECLGDYDKFQSEIKRLHTFADGRDASLRAQLQEEFSLSDSYMKEVFGA